MASNALTTVYDLITRAPSSTAMVPNNTSQALSLPAVQSQLTVSLSLTLPDKVLTTLSHPPFSNSAVPSLSLANPHARQPDTIEAYHSEPSCDVGQRVTHHENDSAGASRPRAHIGRPHPVAAHSCRIQCMCSTTPAPAVPTSNRRSAWHCSSSTPALLSSIRGLERVTATHMMFIGPPALLSCPLTVLCSHDDACCFPLRDSSPITTYTRTDGARDADGIFTTGPRPWSRCACG